jgi:hypothetical protein
MTVYHITAKWRVATIAVEGLNPKRNSGHADRVWLCDRKRIIWVMNHVEDVKHLPMDSLTILAVEISPDDLVRHRRGVYWTAKHVSSENLSISTRLAFEQLGEPGGNLLM